jgi:hypothetical protein
LEIAIGNHKRALIHDPVTKPSGTSHRLALLSTLLSSQALATETDRITLCQSVQSMVLVLSQNNHVIYKSATYHKSLLYDHTYHGITSVLTVGIAPLTFNKLSQLPVHNAMPSPETPIQLILLSCPDRTPILSPLRVSHTLQL